MGNNLVLSIIIPTYNRETTIITCLQSLCNQKFESVEIIVVDDASEDQTVQLVEEFTQINNLPLVLITLPENKGPGNARNEGMQKALGKYVTFIDSDDTVESTYIQTIEEAVEKFKCDLLIIKYRRKYFRKSKFIENVYPYSGIKKEDSIGLQHEELFTKVEASSVIKIIKNEVLILNPEIKFSNHKIGEDLLFSLKLYAHIQSYVILPDVLYNYHLYENSLSRQPRTILDYIGILEETVDYYKAHNAFNQRFFELEYVLTKHLILPNLLKFYNHKNKGNYPIFLQLRSSLSEVFPSFYKNKYLENEPFYVKMILKVVKFSPRLFKLLIQ